MWFHDQFSMVIFIFSLKQYMLGECAKTRFMEVKTPSRSTIIGYVDAVNKLHTFQEKIPTDSKQIDRQSLIWENIKLGSPYLDEWEDLFTNSNTDL